MYLHALLLLGRVSPYQCQLKVAVWGSPGFSRFLTLLIHITESKFNCGKSVW